MRPNSRLLDVRITLEICWVCSVLKTAVGRTARPWRLPPLARRPKITRRESREETMADHSRKRTEAEARFKEAEEAAEKEASGKMRSVMKANDSITKGQSR
jgi:hypothetical protein